MQTQAVLPESLAQRNSGKSGKRFEIVNAPPHPVCPEYLGKTPVPPSAGQAAVNAIELKSCFAERR
jgi:hypothetical protein